MYKVKIKYFSDKIYNLDNIEDIINEIKIFSNIASIYFLCVIVSGLILGALTLEAIVYLIN